MVYISNGEHDNPVKSLKINLEGSLDDVHDDYTHTDIPPKIPEKIEKLEYICRATTVLGQPERH